ncbi:DEAD/DEAH box helicase [Clostridium tunisiense]|uniref:DEAD/DEAH box helicase n=1 Tax=Clostridium tunisiense TaxID=219748 RepID=UPI0002D2FDF5|nr:DEAD/DEAH box helicase [Clostridium tunisiense]
MVTEDMLLQIFTEETSGKNHIKGQRILNNELVSSVDIIADEDLICITGNVISENLFNEYSTKIEMNGRSKNFISTGCTCADFEKNGYKSSNYCCKHLVATFFSSIDNLVKHPLLSHEEETKNLAYKHKGNILSMLLGDEEDKEEIKIEVYINKSQWDDELTAEFKVGFRSMGSSELYVMRDINQFLLACDNSFPVTYSKNFNFYRDNHKLSPKDKKLIDFIKMLKTIEGNGKYGNRDRKPVVEGKYINIPNYLVREFFNTIRMHRVYLNEGFFSRTTETEILLEAPFIDFDIKTIKTNYVLKSPGGMPKVLGINDDVFLYGTTIYLPNYEFCYKIKPYLQVFSDDKVISIDMAEEDTILRKLIPNLNMLSPKVTLAKSVRDKIVMGSCCFKFYFDQRRKDITVTLKVKYETYEFNILEDFTEKVIYRDHKSEAQVIGTIKRLGFEEIRGKFYFRRGEDYIFNFFKSEVHKLQEIGEVYYSENFKGIKSIGTKGINAVISSGKHNYFEMDFQIGNVDSKETTKILRAFRDNLKYYKLKTGEYLDLEELEMNKFLKLLDSLSEDNIENNKLEITKNKALYLETYLEENSIRYIKGKSKLKEITEKIKKIDKLEFKEVTDLKGTLREYQKVGYNWLKTLEYLGFGGILGDEMGLGKTFQTIAYVASCKKTKALIITPTSLVYNWVEEFEKFAPNCKVVAISGTKGERELIIENLEQFDVAITSYNLLKRDLQSYNKIEFYNVILDEAQNIKNANSQNARAVKEIKGKNRFALTGTPIENSLMELWSIFDFVMPGYLYDEKRFSVRYHKKLKEGPEILEELRKLVNPFILRRRKSDVIKELPEKIEKTIRVSLNEEQKKIYKVYAGYAMELIEKKVRNEEFETSKIEILSYITKLRQICLDPKVLMSDYTGESGKVEALVELLHKSIGGGHRVLVFSQFTSVLKNIGSRISSEGITYSYLDGAVPLEKRMDMVKNFNEGENSVFLISLKAGGTGLNLTSADIVIHFDPWWNPAVEDQATDRAHRIGQENVVEVIKIIAKGTIEEKILQLQEEKKKLISELMGDEFSSGEGFSALSEGEILELFQVQSK